MRVSRRWLKQYVTIGLSDIELADRLTMAGLEVEAVESQAAALHGIVVGEVRSVERHPNASKLTVCRVHDGASETQVVCGAPNVAAGQKVAFAPAGATVPRNQHDPEGSPLVIGRVTLRGVESAGMICSGYELGISDDREGILILEPSAKPGTPLSSHLDRDDTIFEIGVTANRPDLLSHIGVAREIAALTGARLRLPSAVVRERGRPVRRALSVSVEDREACPRYCARVVEGVKVGQSPEWLRAALQSVGIRPLNNVVDVTNYVLMETGHPLHAFDYDRIAGHAIVVRNGRAGETLVTLDGRERSIDDQTLLICDAGHPIALAGVMGGLNSEITGSTTTVVVESAYFAPAGIRKTSKRLGLSTEASQRFERGADPNGTLRALDRAAKLLTELAGGMVLKGIIDVYPKKFVEAKVPYDVSRSNELLGISIDLRRVSMLFGRIGIRPSGKARGRTKLYSIPTWRPDIGREVDLVEEAARLHGYDRIDTAPRASITLGNTPREPAMADRLGEYLADAGFREIVTNSMTDPSTAGAFGLVPVTIANPIGLDMAALRTSLVPGMLTTIRHNIYHGITSARFYETGAVFRTVPGKDPEQLEAYHEEERLCMAIFGQESPTFWGEKGRSADLFTMKGEATALLGKFSLDNPRYIPYSTPSALTEGSLSIEIQGERVGILGNISADLLKRYDIETDVVLLDVSVQALAKAGAERRVFTAYPRFPVVRRDLAVIVDEAVPVGSIEDAIRQAGGPGLRDVVLFDVYRGEQAGAGKKSCAFSLEFVPRQRTMEQQEIAAVMSEVTRCLTSRLGAVLRQ